MITKKNYEQEINALKDFIKKNNDVLGYYVYALIDPRNSRKQIFYIGKGCKNQ